MSGLSLDALRDCLEGAIPALVATCSADGTPNVSYVSQVHYVDGEHVALSFQFFNKTRHNVLENPHATLLVANPATAALYRFAVEYLRTETGGPLFEGMKAKLAGIASHTGMAGVFHLKGADVYRVRSIERVAGSVCHAPLPHRNLLAAVRRAGPALASARDLGALFEQALDALERDFGVRHAMILIADESGESLYTVASRGYPQSGIGSEIRCGDGVIGVAARERAAIRINHSTAEYCYGRALRESASQSGDDVLPTEIPFPGLAAPGSQLAVPIVHGARLAGVLFVEDPEAGRFNYDDEDALAALAAQLAAGIQLLQGAETDEDGGSAKDTALTPRGRALVIRRYAANDSVFLDDDYLIKGVAGAIFWKLVGDHVREGRSEFTNRELRLDPAIRLPALSENLEARLILLERRLAERGGDVRIEKTGRGRFRLLVRRPLELAEVPAAH
ncbi:MAG: ptsP [Proteobacteria bacterium]|nr:ptsP [Pseudomonadota bacterium]